MPVECDDRMPPCPEIAATFDIFAFFVLQKKSRRIAAAAFERYKRRIETKRKQQRGAVIRRLV
jgi:hypothetical protein